MPFRDYNGYVIWKKAEDETNMRKRIL